HGNGDLVAHFFRRAFNLLRRDGCFGLIATKTIGKGDTRQTGLRWLFTHGGTIYNARRRIKWPGAAAVVVNVVNACRGPATDFHLDGRPVQLITAYLFHQGGHENPARLTALNGIVHTGSKVTGKGFVLSHEERDRFIRRSEHNAEVIHPYLDGDDLNADPDDS